MVDRHSTPALCALLLSLGVSGCVSAMGTAKTRAANDFQCQEENVVVTSIGGTSYRATGCGKAAVYNCAASDAHKGSTTSYACVPESAPVSK